MELWYSEKHTPDVKLSIRIEGQLYSGSSEFQKIDVFQTAEFGRMLTLDGLIMLTEKDEFVYHDMIVHVPMATNPAIRDVLVIGAGDGGVVRELTRYPFIRHIDMVEIDRQVVDVCREFLPQTACRLDDPRVTVHYEDGVRFVRDKEDAYDLVIVDSTDPFGPGEGLTTMEFYGSCANALRADGILVNQHESPYYTRYARAMRRAHKKIASFFPITRVYQAHIPTYPSGHWLFGFASNVYDPLQADLSAWDKLGIRTKYYNTALHSGCFALPTYVNEMLEGNDEAEY